jgi:hypothetical protein
VLEIGKNSVKPSTNPRTSALSSGITSTDILIELESLQCKRSECVERFRMIVPDVPC